MFARYTAFVNMSLFVHSVSHCVAYRDLCKFENSLKIAHENQSQQRQNANQIEK